MKSELQARVPMMDCDDIESKFELQLHSTLD